MLAWWRFMIRFALLRQLPQRAEEVVAWSVTVPFTLWNDAFRYDGRSFRSAYSATLPPWIRPLVPLRALYLAFLFCWPLVACWRSIKRGRAVMRTLRGHFERAELVFSHLDAEFTEQEWQWSRPDMVFSMLAAWEFQHLRPAYGQLEHKATFLKRALEAGLPVPPELTLEQALASRELFIVKDPDMDLGAGVELMDGEELSALAPEERAVMILQPRLRNHPVLRALYPPDAPLSTLRVTTTLNPLTRQPEVTRCALRMGRAGSLVDNTARGGIWSNINLQDGTLTAGVKRHTFGKYRDGKALRHEVHPDTGKRFVGLRVPWFEEGKALALEAHQMLAPDALTLGWDIALWEERPVLLEVNVWTVVYDYDPPFDAFTPGIQLVLERLKQSSGH